MPSLGHLWKKLISMRHTFSLFQKGRNKGCRHAGSDSGSGKKRTKSDADRTGAKASAGVYGNISGREKEVLFEEQQEIDGKLYWTGHTMEYLKVAMLSEENLSNQLLQVNLTEILRDGVLLGCRE